MPRQFYLADSGWWQVPLFGEPGSIYMQGEVERGPDNPPPLVVEHELPAEQLGVEHVVEDELPWWYEDGGPHIGEDARLDWHELAEEYFRGELQPLDASQFDPLRYQSGQACTVPTEHPPPGTIIGGPNACPGTHCPSTPPNNWQSDNAVDIWLYPGTVVRAVAAGTVSRSLGYGRMGDESSQFGGSRLHVEHAGGWVSFYTHLERITIGRGRPVRRGQAIGRSGFGNCVPHLHLGVTPGRDPRDYARLSYNADAPPAPPRPVEEPPGVRGPLLPRTLDQSWSNVTHAIGPDRRRYRRRIAAARRALRESLR